MSEGPARIKSKTNAEIGKPLDGWDLLDLGLPVDHFYRRFVELGRDRCPRCDGQHLNIQRKTYKDQRGWLWVCMNCAQRWSEPKVTQGLERGKRSHSQADLTSATK